jgi:uncharacterized membrane protein
VPQRALSRAAIACAVALLVGLLLGRFISFRLALLSGWDAGAVTLLLLAWRRVWVCDSGETCAHAASDDPGRAAVFVLVLLAASSSLLSTVALVHKAKAIGAEGDALVALSLLNVALSWAVAQTAFALRYAHLYYREDAEGVGGVEFPGGGQPSYFDFAYLAFTVGMCFQVSDTSVSSPQIRRAVLLHALMAFVYNTAILAFALNLVFGLAS